GIGAACAEVFAKKGAHLALAARRVERLEKLAQDLKAKYPVQIFVKKADVSKLEEVQEFVKASVAALSRIDVLINNAGVGCVGKIADVDLDLAHQVLETNFFGVLHFIQEVVPLMRKQGQGHIVNVSSVIGKRSVPKIGIYCASKFAVSAM